MWKTEEEAKGHEGGQGHSPDLDEEDEEEELSTVDTMVVVRQTHIIAAESTAPSIAFDPTTRLDMRTEEGLQFQMTPLMDLGQQQIQEPVTEVNGSAKSVSGGGSRLCVHASSADLLLVCEWD